jgi:four helix bundle protein
MSDSAKSIDLGERTVNFAMRIIRLYSALPKTVVAQVIGKQVLRSGTSVGAQYREARRGRSSAEFVSKLDSALQELEETDYWLDLLVRGAVVSAKRLADLRAETKELIAIFIASSKTAKSRK